MRLMPDDFIYTYLRGSVKHQPWCLSDVCWPCQPAQRASLDGGQHVGLIGTVAGSKAWNDRAGID